MNLKNFNELISSREFSEKLRKEFKKGNYKSPAEAAKVILSSEIPDKDTLNNLIASSNFNQNWKDNLKITENMNTKLRQLIRESINEYIREIDEAGTTAMYEAKINKIKEAIESREKKMNMEGLDEAYHDMLDKGKMKEIGNEIKALKKSLAKYEKQLDKLKNKGKKSEEPTEEKEIVDEANIDEVNIDENFPENGPQLEEGNLGHNETWSLEPEGRFWILTYSTMDGKKEKTFDSEAEAKKWIKQNLEEDTLNESFLHMQKLAGLITEAQYKEKLNK